MLTHVSIWTEHGWTHITEEEARRMYSGSNATVSSNSKCFMCELCGHFVTFTRNTSKRDRYFRHSRGDEDKDCTERSTSNSIQQIQNKYEKIELPLKLVEIKRGIFEIQLGIPAISEGIKNRFLNCDILIKGMSSKNRYSSSFVYSMERIDPYRVTYFPLGKSPSLTYKIDFTNTDDTDKKVIHFFIPSQIRILNEEDGYNFAFFNKDSGLKIPVMGDVVPNKAYYLVTTKNYSNINNKNGLYRMHCGDLGGFHVYLVSATGFTEGAAKFFLENRARLINRNGVIEMIPVWPASIISNYSIFYPGKALYIYTKGDDLKVYLCKPFEDSRKINQSGNKLMRLTESGNNSFISAGRIGKSLRYMYLWHHDIPSQDLKNVKVINGKIEVKPGIYTKLPTRNTLTVYPVYDGFITIGKKDKVLESGKNSHF